uniref:MYND-type domain-containing protein n=1 Tax=Mycena chlorophos TaxID=658473 RepID=A0ABQ0LYT3_MYCCL|nr:predicted protein [Mycena chlorophos]
MHKIFQLSSMASIPRPGKVCNLLHLSAASLSSAQDFVLAALRGNDRDMEALLTRIMYKRIARSQLPKLFCVFYAVLDPAPIAELLESDLTSSAVRSEVRRISLAFEGLDMVVSNGVWADGTGAELPTDALEEFFPRMLSCMEAWDTLAEALYATNRMERVTGHQVQLHAVKFLCRNPAARDVIFSAANTRIYWILGRLWALIPRTPMSPITLGDTIHLICWLWDQDYLLFQDGINHRYKILELLQGIGGDWETLGRLCNFNMRFYFPTPASPVGSEVITVMRTVMWAIRAATARERTFYETLRRGKMGTAMVYALRSLIADGQVGANFTSTWVCLKTIGLCLVAPLDGAFFVETVKAGLVRAVCQCASYVKPTEHEAVAAISHMFFMGLSSYFSNYRLLKTLRDTPFDQDMHFARGLTFRHQPMLDDFRHFAAFTFSRMLVAREFETGGLSSLKGCDNPTCLKIMPSANFKCCGGCRKMLYCSAECQKAAWRSGHKQYCASRLKNAQQIPLSRKEKSFLRALANHEWLQSRQRNAVTLLQLCLQRQRPEDSADAFTIFDNASDNGVSAVEVLPYALAPAEFKAEAHAEDLLRANQSRGRLQLHYVVFRRVDGAAGVDDQESRIVLPLPLHCQTADVSQEVGRIAAELIPCADWQAIDLGPYIERLKVLVESDDSNFGLH